MLTSLWLSLGIPMICFAAPSQPVPVILDTDLGDDIDDTWALGMLLGCPQVDVKLIVTASDDTAVKTRLTAKILERIGRSDIPIATGVKTSDNAIHQAQWLGDYSLKQYKGVVREDGVGALIAAIHASPTPVTLLIIGPQTNIKAALERDPSIAKKARVVSMAGSVHIGYGGATGRAPEYNVSKDVAAAKAVFAAPWEITLAPLDICGTLILKGPRYETVRASKDPKAVAVMENYAQWTLRKDYPQDASSILYDTVAAYLAFDESLCAIETVKLSVDDKGNTAPDEGGRPVRCALKWRNRDKFEDLLVDSLTHAVSKPVPSLR